MDGYFLLIFLIPSLFIEACSAFCITSFFSLSRAQLDSMKKSKDAKKKAIAAIMATPDEVLVTIIIQDIIGTVLSQNIFSTVFALHKSIFMSVVLPFLMSAIFAQIIPKAIAIKYNLYIAQTFLPIFLIFHKLFSIPRRFIVFFLKYMFHSLNISSESIGNGPSIYEQISAVDMCDSENLISSDEKKIFEGILRFASLRAKDIMLHRSHVKFFNLDDDISYFHTLSKNRFYNHVLVASGSISDIKGFVDVNDMVALNKNVSSKKDILPFLKKPIYIPESLPCEMLFQKMGAGFKNSLFVVDEYGGVCGLINYNILLESIIGENLGSKVDTCYMYEICDDGIVVSGSCSLDTVENFLGLHIEDRMGQNTVSGLVMAYTNIFPPFGAKVVAENGSIEMLILSVHNHHLKYVYIYKNSVEN